MNELSNQRNYVHTCIHTEAIFTECIYFSILFNLADIFTVTPLSYIDLYHSHLLLTLMDAICNVTHLNHTTNNTFHC